MDHTRNIHTTHKTTNNLFINLLKRNAMKKYFLLAAAAATVLAVSCNKEKNQPTTDPTPQIEDNTPQPIRFGTNIAEVKAPITKAAIENHGWDGEDLFIYAFGTAANGSVDVANLLIGSATAGAPAKAPLATSTPTGNRDAITLEKDANTHEPYYYTVGEVYNFFGYYVGDATLGTMTDYQLPITINGTQDIMVATTDKIADYMAATPAANVSLDKVYSDASARDHIKPDLMFKHQLSRFVFKTKFAGTGANTSVAFKSLTLKSYNKGTLTVAAADPNAIGFIANSNEARADLALAGFTPYTNTTDFGAAAHPGDGAFVKLGESILAVPEGNNTNHAKYNATLTIGQINTATTPATIQEQDYNFVIDFEKIEDPNTHQPIAHAWAEPGKQYTVNIQVYGFEKIEITVSLENWGEGGETEIDPDLDEREAVTIVAALDAASIEAGSTTNVTVTSASTPSVADLTGNVQYSSSNTRVATVSDAGVVTGVNPGSCKIYVVVPGTTTYQSGFVALDLTVTAPASAAPTATALAGVPAAQNIDNTSGNATYSITGVTVQAAGVNLDPQPTLTYASSDEAIATVNASGVVTAVANGTATITITYAGDATYAACNGTVDVTVENTPLPAATITIEAGFDTIDAGATGTAFTSSEFSVTSNAGAISFTCSEPTVTVEAGTTDTSKWVVKTTDTTPTGVYTINVTAAADATHAAGAATITVTVS